MQLLKFKCKTKSEKEMKSLNDEEVKLQNVVEGIILVIEKNPNDQEAVQDYNEMDKRQQEIDVRQDELLKEIETIEKDLGEYKLALNKIANEINFLEKEANTVVADMELANMREQIETRKAGLQNLLICLVLKLC